MCAPGGLGPAWMARGLCPVFCVWSDLCVPCGSWVCGMGRAAGGSLPEAPATLEGTTAYLSPEVIRGGASTSVASDCWALGCVLYQCIVGRPPVWAETQSEVCMPVVLVRDRGMCAMCAMCARYLRLLVVPFPTPPPQHCHHHPPPPPPNAPTCVFARDVFSFFLFAWQVMDKIVSFDCERTFPRDFPPVAKDLVTRLMDPNPETRLGGGGRGLAEVKVCACVPVCLSSCLPVCPMLLGVALAKVVARKLCCATLILALVTVCLWMCAARPTLTSRA